MGIREILQQTEHRPWVLPTGNWRYYQEWNNAVFLHWQVDLNELRQFVPDDLVIDLLEGKAWVSLVAFTMEKIRPRNLPAFSPVSDFHEINIRTYVKYKGKAGVYFLSIEGGAKLSCQIAKTLSALPYRFSKIKRTYNHYYAENSLFKDRLELNYKIGPPLTEKTQLDKWLTERYALFQDTETSINEFEIHHVEWPTYEVALEHINVNYPRFGKLLSGTPDLSHYSTGVKVIAWDKKRYEK
ncbi:YqjF family protein [Pontibacter ramchanderi]|uniref:DUF2071 domain-containing protein n=1 Tax=Pontibacter ramchanderi TaxID=1179743 RepID=A0A2N3UBY7_9BACT|nr:DUF2071 domain-containing protein [Pontibacter ramchanderi]PKV66908.1 hypothetical protein BD749_2045 [Pontibacter ramchanderi]